MGLESPKVGIIGGSGKMGAWLSGLLRGRGLTVLSAGRSTELTPGEMARQCDVVVISVPIADTERIIKEIGPLIPEDGVLMDLASVKKGPVESMLRHSRAQVVGIHPLFGPNSISSRELRVAICPGRGESGLDWITTVFRDAGFRVTLLEPEEHDRIMGLIQGVNHFSTLALGLCIRGSGIDVDDLVNLSTQTFLERMNRIETIIEQPAELFRSLLMENPAAGEFIEQYLES
ncbi:MAG: prephenate dehydrogenase/arogenate dehydrogenase family protein, partial [Deltaproteobacteria bacterium]|nr:prephenate dehydrogenase/arogenate dehydrogenase family protein [Deltaproteobacteria bacterium]